VTCVSSGIEPLAWHDGQMTTLATTPSYRKSRVVETMVNAGGNWTTIRGNRDPGRTGARFLPDVILRPVATRIVRPAARPVGHPLYSNESVNVMQARRSGPEEFGIPEFQGPASVVGSKDPSDVGEDSGLKRE
jgi:hypothetical protein